MKLKRLEKLHKKSYQNKESIKSTGFAGCFFCLKWSSFKQIKEYTDRGLTALCPHCNIDSLIAYPIEEHESCIDELREMEEYYFSYKVKKD